MVKCTTCCINVAPPPELTVDSCNSCNSGRIRAGVGQNQELGSGPRARFHSCSAPTVPFCPLPPAFIFGSCPEHSCVIAVAQCRGHTHTHTRLFSPACSIFLFPPAERWGLFTAGGYSCWLNKWAIAGSYYITLPQPLRIEGQNAEKTHMSFPLDFHI